jgi:hypothetical protein
MSSTGEDGAPADGLPGLLFMRIAKSVGKFNQFSQKSFVSSMVLSWNYAGALGVQAGACAALGTRQGADQ